MKTEAFSVDSVGKQATPILDGAPTDVSMLSGDGRRFADPASRQSDPCDACTVLGTYAAQHAQQQPIALRCRTALRIAADYVCVGARKSETHSCRDTQVGAVSGGEQVGMDVQGCLAEVTLDISSKRCTDFMCSLVSQCFMCR